MSFALLHTVTLILAAPTAEQQKQDALAKVKALQQQFSHFHDRTVAAHAIASLGATACHYDSPYAALLFHRSS